MAPVARVLLSIPLFWRSSSVRMCQCLTLLLILLPSSTLLRAQEAANQDVLTNQAVIELTRAKVGEGVIIGMIQTLPTRFSLTKDAIIQLKQQGVSDKILAAMVKRGASASATPAPSLAAARHQVLSAEEKLAASETVGEWEIRDKQDPMTDKESFEAYMIAKNNRRERIEVTASCSSDAATMIDPTSALSNVMQSFANSMSNGGGTGNPLSPDKLKTRKMPPIESMGFDIRYSPKAGQHLVRSKIPVTGDVERAPEVFGQQIGNDTVTLRGGGSCVYLRMRVGDALYNRVKGGCGNTNVLQVAFVSQMPKASDMFSMPASGNNPRVDSFASSLFSMMGNYAEMEVLQDQGYDASLHDLLNADKFLVELPADDGTTSVVPIPTQEPSFKKFAARCAADFAKLLAIATPAAPPPSKPNPSPFSPERTANLSGWAKAMVNPPRFAGTADQFAASLPDLLRKAASEAGFDAQAFAKESAFVVDSVRACAQITPAMATQATWRGPTGRGPGIVDVRMLGKQYAACQNGGSTESNVQYPDTAIIFQVDSRGGQNWVQGKGFRVFAFFHNEQGSYPIVSATIPSPSNTDLDVKSEPKSLADAGQNSVPSLPLVHTLDDTYVRTLQIINDNTQLNTADPLRANDIPFAYACFGITERGQCQRSGEIVRVPGDLAKPLDWDSVSRLDHCAGRIAIGDEVALKAPATNDGRTRYLRCSDAMRLAQFHQRLVQLGVK